MAPADTAQETRSNAQAAIRYLGCPRQRSFFGRGCAPGRALRRATSVRRINRPVAPQIATAAVKQLGISRHPSQSARAGPGASCLQTRILRILRVEEASATRKWLVDVLVVHGICPCLQGCDLHRHDRRLLNHRIGPSWSHWPATISIFLAGCSMPVLRSASASVIANRSVSRGSVNSQRE